MDFILNISTIKINFEIFCEFNENGTINIKFDSDELLTINDINKIIKKSIDEDILNKIRIYFKQSGYDYIYFNTIKDSNILINNLQLKYALKNKYTKK